MDPSLVWIYMRHIEAQAQMVVRAARDIDEQIALVGPGKEPDYPPVWYALQALLNAAANIKKACWGSDSNRAKQRERLRELLELDDDSVLRKVDMRNSFEHLDERIEEWWSKGDTKHFADMVLRNNAIDDYGVRNIFRQFDPVTGEIIFWGEQYSIRAVVAEAQHILDRLYYEYEEQWYLNVDDHVGTNSEGSG